MAYLPSSRELKEIVMDWQRLGSGVTFESDHCTTRVYSCCALAQCSLLIVLTSIVKGDSVIDLHCMLTEGLQIQSSSPVLLCFWATLVVTHGGPFLLLGKPDHS